MDSKDFFSKNGILDQHLDSYEERQQQVCMAIEVEKAIKDSYNLIVEAGTGVGKSLAYLVPFIQWSVQNNKKVIISTYTKTLQNQLFIKELPFLKEILDFDFNYALCLGSENYICFKKTHAFFEKNIFNRKLENEFLKIKEWFAITETGLITDLDFMPSKYVWSIFARERDLCLGKNCKYCKKCFYLQARQVQKKSDILISNHALFFSNIMSKKSVFPEYDAIVFDEAHTLEDVATKYLGKQMNNINLKYLLENILNVFLDGLKEKRFEEFKNNIINILENIEYLSRALNIFFYKIGKTFSKEDSNIKFDKKKITYYFLIKYIERLIDSFLLFIECLDKDNESIKFKAYFDRIIYFYEVFRFFFIENENKNYVYWLEIKKYKTIIKYSFNVAPIDISSSMKNLVFEKTCPIILTSATLTVLNKNKTSFDFIKNRIGIENSKQLCLDSPFDFLKNVIIYAPKDILDPNIDTKKYMSQLKHYIIKMYDLLGGRIFCLFTSYYMLDFVAKAILDERSDINILKQGQLPRNIILDLFKKDKDIILFGTSTFWQGIDVPGDSLECVIITKLPFSVPTDPINAARIKYIKGKQLNPFNEYQLPQAIIMFKQGFGRLIRRKTDKGIIVILDSRVSTRYYGKSFLNSIPKCKITNKFEEVENFF